MPCLECNYVCNKCVDVCPNRANLALKIEGFRDVNQIIHVDAYCNECGNCATFCPYDGRPYKDKLTVFNMAGDFDNSTNSGFLVSGREVKLRLEGTVYDMKIDERGELTGAGPEHPDFQSVRQAVKTIYTDYRYLLGAVEV